MHDKILKFSNLNSSNSLPAKYFPLASPRALSNLASISLRHAQNYSAAAIMPVYKHKLERLRDSSPLRINKYFPR